MFIAKSGGVSQYMLHETWVKQGHDSIVKE